MLLPELHGLICSHLSTRDLELVRLACQDYNHAAIPFLFHRIHMSFNMTDLRIAKQVTLRFKQHIRTLVFSSVSYKKVGFENFENEIYENGATWDGNIELTEDVYSLYRSLCKTQRDTLASGACPSYLSAALSSLTRLRRIVWTDILSSRRMASTNVTEYESYPTDRSNLTEDDWRYLERNRLSFTERSGFLKKGSQNPWHTILLALSALGTTVPEIVMECKHEWDSVSLNTSGFKLPAPDLVQAKICFSALRKLRMTLQAEPERFNSKGGGNNIDAEMSLYYVLIACLDIGTDFNLASRPSEALNPADEAHLESTQVQIRTANVP